jgi:predicted Zn-dependent protease
MSKGVLTNALVGSVAIIAGTQSQALGELTSQLGMVGAGALLASYSRDNEREADALGLEYMVNNGYGAKGFVGLMDMLRSMSKHKPSAIELMFATHLMSDERYQTSVTAVNNQYASKKDLPLHRDRYMDHTANLRKIKGAVETMQKAESEMANGKFDGAEALFKRALKEAPSDYAGLVLMSKCQLAQKKYGDARRFAEKAKKVYPEEAQAHMIAGFVKIHDKKYDAAHQDFVTYDKLLPGNPNILFFKGLSSEGMNRIEASAKDYYQYLQIVNQGDKAKYAYQRLVKWGYIKP